MLTGIFDSLAAAVQFYSLYQELKHLHFREPTELEGEKPSKYNNPEKSLEVCDGGNLIH